MSSQTSQTHLVTEKDPKYPQYGTRACGQFSAIYDLTSGYPNATKMLASTYQKALRIYQQQLEACKTDKQRSKIKKPARKLLKH